MRLKRIKIQNFLSYVDADKNLEDFRRVLIVGENNGDSANSNGSGKTNFCEAISWAVWGESKAKTIDLNVKEGTSFCCVELWFEHDNKECHVRRTRNSNTATSTVDFWIDGEPSNGKKNSDTDAKIISLIKANYLTYINSVYLRQDDIYSLANQSKSDNGRSVLENVLGLTEYDEYEVATKKRITNLNKSITESSFFIEKNKDIESKIKLVNDSLIQYKKELDLINPQIEKNSTILSSLEGRYNSEKDSLTLFNSLNEQLRRIDIFIDSKTKELARAKEQGALEISNRAARIEDLNKKILEKSVIEQDRNAFLEEDRANDVLKNELSSLQQSLLEEKESLKQENSKLRLSDNEILLIKKDVDNSKKELEKIGAKAKDIKIVAGQVCEVCMSDVTEHNIDLLKTHGRTKYEEEHAKLSVFVDSLTKKQEENQSISLIVKQLESKVSSIEKQIDIIKPKIITQKQREDRLMIFSDKLSQIYKYEAQLNDLPETKIIEMLKTRVSSTKKEIEENQSQKEEITKNLSTININTDLLNDISKQIESAKKELEENKKQSYTLLASIENNERNLKDYDIIFTEFSERTNSLKVEHSQLVVLQQLERAFSSKGVRARILEDAIQDLEFEANSLLKRLTGGRMSLTFVTEKSDKVVFEVHINDGEKTLPFYLYSGGEKFRIAFVLRIALSKLLLRKANSKLEFLIIDEAVSPLDASGVENMMQIINELQDEFKTIMVITHRTDIKNMFDQVMTVYRDEEGSKIV